VPIGNLFVAHYPARKMTAFWAIHLLKKDISKLLNKLGHVDVKNTIDNNKYIFFMSHNFLRVSRNIYQLHNFCQIRVSLFWPGMDNPLPG